MTQQSTIRIRNREVLCHPGTEDTYTYSNWTQAESKATELRAQGHDAIATQLSPGGRSIYVEIVPRPDDDIESLWDREARRLAEHE